MTNKELEQEQYEILEFDRVIGYVYATNYAQAEDLWRIVYPGLRIEACKASWKQLQPVG